MTTKTVKKATKKVAKKTTKKAVIVKEKKTAGRPTDYTEELGIKICEVISISKDSIDDICKANDDFPAPAQVYKWRIRFPEFAARFAKAKELQQEVITEYMREVVENRDRDMMETEKGYVGNPVAIARDKLIVDYLKWRAAKVAPKTYGDKVQQEVTVIKHEDALKELE